MLHWKVNDMVEGKGERAQRLRKGGSVIAKSALEWPMSHDIPNNPVEGSLQTSTSKSASAAGPVAVTRGW